MNRQALNVIANQQQVSKFTKSVEAVVISKIIKFMTASEATLSKYDQRSPALVFAKALRRSIGAAGGERVGKAYFAFNTAREITKAVAPVIKEAEDNSTDLHEKAREIIDFIDQSIIDPADAHLIPLITESKGSSKYKVLHPANRKKAIKEFYE